jgi:hypothetical protein
MLIGSRTVERDPCPIMRGMPIDNSDCADQRNVSAAEVDRVRSGLRSGVAFWVRMIAGTALAVLGGLGAGLLGLLMGLSNDAAALVFACFIAFGPGLLVLWLVSDPDAPRVFSRVVRRTWRRPSGGRAEW